ncbi:hypothetical protein WDW86_13510 [Bdellovibrionota bacterium FG-2]
MARKKLDSQGEIIDELRKSRAELWREYHGDMKKLHADARKTAKKLGMRYATPPRSRDRTKDDEDAA